MHVVAFQFFFIESKYSREIPLKWLVYFLKSWTSTYYFSNSTGSFVAWGRFSPNYGYQNCMFVDPFVEAIDSPNCGHCWVCNSNGIWKRSPILQICLLWCLFFNSHLTPHQSNIGVLLRKGTKLDLYTLDVNIDFLQKQAQMKIKGIFLETMILCIFDKDLWNKPSLPSKWNFNTLSFSNIVLFYIWKS